MVDGFTFVQSLCRGKMFPNGRVTMLTDEMMHVSADIICIAQITFKELNKSLCVDNWRLVVFDIQNFFFPDSTGGTQIFKR